MPLHHRCSFPETNLAVFHFYIRDIASGTLEMYNLVGVISLTWGLHMLKLRHWLSRLVAFLVIVSTHSLNDSLLSKMNHIYQSDVTSYRGVKLLVGNLN